MFEKIDKLIEELNKYKPLTLDELSRLRDEFLVEFTYNTNAIEGSTLTLDETALIINEVVTIGGKTHREHLEVIGHKEAFLYVMELVNENVPMSERIIKDIHSMVLLDKPSNRGVYRNLPVTIMGSDNEVPQPYIVEPLMQDLITNYNNDKNKHIVYRVSLFHLQFESIHPFLDGNGRTGRLLLNLELMKNGIPPIIIKFEDRSKYYNCFSAYHKSDGAPNEMIELISGYVFESLEKYLNIVKQIKK